MESSETGSEAAALGLVPSQASNNNNARRRRNRGKNKKNGGAATHNEATCPSPDDEQGNNKVDGGAKTNQSDPTPAEQAKNPPKKNKGRGRRPPKRDRKKYPWRRFLPKGATDPITIESLASLEYPPFALAASEPFVPIPEWPVPETNESNGQPQPKQEEKMSQQEWERQILQQQWGDAAAGVMPEQEEVKEESEVIEEVPPQRRHYNLFDGRALAYYLVSQLQFIDPFNRRDLTRDELVNLDEYLVRHGFNDLKVTEAYDAKGVTISTAGAAGATAEGRASILQQEANAVLHSIVFGSNELQRQYAASQRRQPQQPRTRQNRREETEDTGIYGDDAGGIVVIDDDFNPGLRGQSIRESQMPTGLIPEEISIMPSTNTLWSSNRIRPANSMSHSARSRAQNFPALPTAAATESATSSQKAPPTTTAAAPSKSLQRITKVVKPTDPAQIKRQKEAREEAQRRAMMANLNYMAPGSVPTEIYGSSNTAQGLLPVPTTGASTCPTPGQLQRNQAMASALGVMPATVRQQLNSGWARPTDVKLELDEFGNELNAANYPDTLIQEAQERMDFVIKLERKWKAFLADDKSASLPLRPMDRPLRTFVHEYSDFWNLHTESFDREPKRYINCVKLRETRVPVPLLSEVARKWRGPAPPVLPRGPREVTINEETSKQAAGQTTASREFPPAPQREPLKLKPRSVPVEDGAPAPNNAEATTDANANIEESQLNSRFDSLFSGRERPKLELAARTVPLELPPFEPPPKQYDVTSERERQKALIAEKKRKEQEAKKQKAKALAYAFASSDEESLASAGGDSDWEEQEQEYSGSDDEA